MTKTEILDRMSLLPHDVVKLASDNVLIHRAIHLFVNTPTMTPIELLMQIVIRQCQNIDLLEKHILDIAKRSPIPTELLTEILNPTESESCQPPPTAAS
jgi:hypothetical protein